MMFLSPEKILVVLAVAVIVLGPDKLPGAARQVSSTWRELKSLRARLETEARTAFPELPAFDAVTQAVRSPLAYLDRLVQEPEPGGSSTPVAIDTPPPAAGAPVGTAAEVEAGPLSDPTFN
jgi:Sec-independent protein translocase protein TatA